MAETSFVAESATLLADLQARLANQEAAQKRAARRTYAVIAVAVVHVLFVLLLLASEFRLIPLPKLQKVEPLQWVTLPPMARQEMREPQKIHPRDDGMFRPDQVLRLPKPKVVEEENNAITDLGWALGRSLACGANSFEWLNTKMRAECRNKPWNFAYDRYGNIVLDARPRIRQEEEVIRPSDAMAQERNTAPACPRNIDPNAPCLSSVIGGRRR